MLILRGSRSLHDRGDGLPRREDRRSLGGARADPARDDEGLWLAWSAWGTGRPPRHVASRSRRPREGVPGYRPGRVAWLYGALRASRSGRSGRIPVKRRSCPRNRVRYSRDQQALIRRPHRVDLVVHDDLISPPPGSSRACQTRSASRPCPCESPPCALRTGSGASSLFTWRHGTQRVRRSARYLPCLLDVEAISFTRPG